MEIGDQAVMHILAATEVGKLPPWLAEGDRPGEGGQEELRQEERGQEDSGQEESE